MSKITYTFSDSVSASVYGHDSNFNKLPSKFLYIITIIFLSLSVVSLIITIHYCQNTKIEHSELILTILMGIFNSLMTLISIIFIYYNFTQKTSIKDLYELLLKIERFAFDYRHIEYRKSNNILHITEKLPYYKNPYLSLRSYFAQYSSGFYNLQYNKSFLTKLLIFDIMVSILSIIILFLAFMIIDITNSILGFTMFGVGLLLFFNCYMANRVVKNYNVAEIFPDPDDLLDPTKELTPEFYQTYYIDKNLPLIFFHVCTAILINPYKDIPKHIQNTNKNKFISIMTLLPFNISHISIEYKLSDESIKTSSVYIDSKKRNYKNSFYYYYFLTNHQLIDSFESYGKSGKKDIIIMHLFNNQIDKTASLSFEYSNEMSSQNHYYYAPTYDFRYIRNDSETPLDFQYELLE